jgi:hypothetical protein
MMNAISKKGTVLGAGAVAALGYAAYGLAAPVELSARACYLCCEDENDCGGGSLTCEDFGGIDCQDTSCHFGGGSDFCAS